MLVRYLATTTVRKLENPNYISCCVGKIIECKRHEDADKLFVSQIDVNAVKPLQVCSGLVDHVPIERMSDARVVVVTNLKPSKMRGVKSEAMVLAAEKDSSVTLVTPHENTAIGSKLHFEGFDPIEKAPRLKSQLWHELQSKLCTSENGTVVFDNHALVDEHGNAATSVPNAGVR